MKTPLRIKNNNSSVFAITALIILFAVIIAVYFDDMPPQPKCEANELAILNSGTWFCVAARKP